MQDLGRALDLRSSELGASEIIDAVRDMRAKSKLLKAQEVCWSSCAPPLVTIEAHLL